MDKDKMEELFQKGIKYDRAGNFEESIKIHRVLAENGHVESMFNFGWAYHEGYGIEKDLKKSFTWMHKAADLGHPKAQYNTGIFYDTGIAGVKDESKALHYFLLAAEQGIDDAQRNAGLMLWSGVGCEKDELKAEELFLAAADNNLSAVYYNLGDMYYSRAMKESLPLTKKIYLQSSRSWFCRSKESGDKSAEKMIKLVDKQITSSI